MFIPSAPKSHVVVKLHLFSPTEANLATLHVPRLVAVLVNRGLVMGGVGPRADVAKVLVNSKSKLTSEIQAPKGTPIEISLGGYFSGQGVEVSVTYDGVRTQIGKFFADANGKLNLPTATLFSRGIETFEFTPGTKVILRPSTKPSFSTLKVEDSVTT